MLPFSILFSDGNFLKFLHVYYLITYCYSAALKIKNTHIVSSFLLFKISLILFNEFFRLLLQKNKWMEVCVGADVSIFAIA